MSNTTILTGRSGRDRYNGATVTDDDFMHLGVLSNSEVRTACEKSADRFLVTYSEVVINCPACVDEIDRRSRRRVERVEA